MAMEGYHYTLYHNKSGPASILFRDTDLSLSLQTTDNSNGTESSFPSSVKHYIFTIDFWNIFKFPLEVLKNDIPL